MTIVWVAFAITAVLLAGGAWAALRYQGEQATAFRSVAGFLLTMAIGTALFPALLPLLGVKLWIGGYIAFVISLTGVMTAMAVVKAKQTT